MQEAVNYKSIRIKPMYGSHDATAANWEWLQTTLMPKTVEYLSMALKVCPMAGKLILTLALAWPTSRCTQSSSFPEPEHQLSLVQGVSSGWKAVLPSLVWLGLE